MARSLEEFRGEPWADAALAKLGKSVPVAPAAESGQEGAKEQPWEVTKRRGGIAVGWKKGNATISVETRPKTKAGTGGQRYVARVGNEQYGSTTLDGAQSWAESALAKLGESATIRPVTTKEGGRTEQPSTPSVRQEGNKKLGEIRYIRFGKPPESGKSYNPRDNVTEEGVSVYKVRRAEKGWEIVGDSRTLGTAASVADRDIFFVKGEELGTGSDGEPILKVSSFRKAKADESVIFPWGTKTNRPNLKGRDAMLYDARFWGFVPEDPQNPPEHIRLMDENGNVIYDAYLSKGKRNQIEYVDITPSSQIPRKGELTAVNDWFPGERSGWKKIEDAKGNPLQESFNPSPRTQSAGPIPQKSIGDRHPILNTQGTVTHADRVDNVDYELYRAADSKDKRGFVRVADAGTGEAVSVKEYPNYEQAAKEYQETVRKAATGAGTPQSQATAGTQEMGQLAADGGKKEGKADLSAEAKRLAGEYDLKKAGVKDAKDLLNKYENDPNRKKGESMEEFLRRLGCIGEGS